MQTQTSLVLARHAHAFELMFTIFNVCKSEENKMQKYNENFSWSNKYVFFLFAFLLQKYKQVKVVSLNCTSKIPQIILKYSNQIKLLKYLTPLEIRSCTQQCQ